MLFAVVDFLCFVQNKSGKKTRKRRLSPRSAFRNAEDDLAHRRPAQEPLDGVRRGLETGEGRSIAPPVIFISSFPFPFAFPVDPRHDLSSQRSGKEVSAKPGQHPGVPGGPRPHVSEDCPVPRQRRDDAAVPEQVGLEWESGAAPGFGVKGARDENRLCRRRRRRLLGRGPQQRATETMSGDEKKRRRRRRRRNRRRKKRRSTRRTRGIDIIIITGGAGARAAAAKAKGRGGGAPTGAAATAMAASILARGRGRGRGDLKERDRPREGRLSPVFVLLKENITYLRIELSNVCSPLRKVGGGQRGRGEQGELDEGGGAEAKRGAATTQLPAREIEFFSPSQLTFGFAPHSLVLLLLLLLPFSCSALSLAASTLRLSETASQNFRSL